MCASSSNSPSGSTVKCSISNRLSASSMSFWERTETYSPTAIDIAPAAIPARPAVIIKLSARAVATPIIKLAVETKPSFAPSTAARNQPLRCVRWCSFRSCTSVNGIAKSYRLVAIFQRLIRVALDTAHTNIPTQMFSLKPNIKLASSIRRLSIKIRPNEYKAT